MIDPNLFCQHTMAAWAQVPVQPAVPAVTTADSTQPALKPAEVPNQPAEKATSSAPASNGAAGAPPTTKASPAQSESKRVCLRSRLRTRLPACLMWVRLQAAAVKPVAPPASC